MKTLVIIDDELEMESLYELMFEDIISDGSIQLHFFSDAREFANWLKIHTPDLVLCDINMPYMSGVEIGRLIKARDPEIPLYFVSGYEASEYRNIMEELGVTHFLTKPLDCDQVINSITSELGL